MTFYEDPSDPSQEAPPDLTPEISASHKLRQIEFVDGVGVTVEIKHDEEQLTSGMEMEASGRICATRLMS